MYTNNAKCNAENSVASNFKNRLTGKHKLMQKPRFLPTHGWQANESVLLSKH